MRSYCSRVPPSQTFTFSPIIFGIILVTTFDRVPPLSIFLKLAWFFRQHWRPYAAAFVALAVIAVLVMIPPWLTGKLVDAVTQRTLTREMLFSHTGGIVLVALLVYGLRYFWRVLLYGSAYQLAAILRQRLFWHLATMSPEFYQRHNTGDLMARTTNDVNAVEATAGEGVLSMVDGAFTGLVVLAMLFVAISWKLALLALLPWPIMSYFMWRFGNELHSAFGVAQARFSDLNDRAQENITTIRLLKAFGQEHGAERAFQAAAQQASAANLAVARVDSKYDPTIFLTIGASFLVAVAGGAYLIAQGELTLGQLTSFTMYLGYLIWPMFAFGFLLNILERGSSAYERIEALFAQQAPVPDTGSKTDLATPSVTFDIVRFAYPGSTATVLEDVRVHVPAGSALGIVGRTGSGKSALMQLLLRHYDGEHARIVLGDTPVQEYSLAALRAHICVVPQEAFLFSATIGENIALGRPDASPEEIQRAAQQACLHDEIMRFPAQYQTVVGERGITLSGGQKQRVAIARALLIGAPVLVLDDALSAVDMVTEKQILRHLREARRGRTTLIVTHRLSAVMEADNIVVLGHGRVVEQGTHAQLVAQSGVYARMYRYQQLEAAVAAGR